MGRARRRARRPGRSVQRTNRGPAGGAPAIPQAFFYALFRAGLPANEDTLYHADARTLEAVWKKAAEQGVIPEPQPTRFRIC